MEITGGGGGVKGRGRVKLNENSSNCNCTAFGVEESGKGIRQWKGELVYFFTL